MSPQKKSENRYTMIVVWSLAVFLAVCAQRRTAAAFSFRASVGRGRSLLHRQQQRHLAAVTAELRHNTLPGSTQRMIPRNRESSRLQSSGKEEEAEAKEELEKVFIDTSQDEIPEDVQNELIENQPSQWSIMKQVRNHMFYN